MLGAFLRSMLSLPFFFTARSYGRIYIIAPFVSELDVLYFDILHKYKRQIQYSYITLP